jgi:hypothetical protein
LKQAPRQPRTAGSPGQSAEWLLVQIKSAAEFIYKRQQTNATRLSMHHKRFRMVSSTPPATLHG